VEIAGRNEDLVLEPARPSLAASEQGQQATESRRAARDVVKAGGMCWTIATAAPSWAGRHLITALRALGPPVEEAITTSLPELPTAGRHCGAWRRHPVGPGANGPASWAPWTVEPVWWPWLLMRS